MRHIEGHNPHCVLPVAARVVAQHCRPRQSRYGPVLVHDGPVTTSYDRPAERVIFWAARDANPFFHLFEALWMLQGRDDAAFVARFAKRMLEFAEPDGRVHDAYGRRWRAHFTRPFVDPIGCGLERHGLSYVDQLREVAEALTRDPDCRRQVVSDRKSVV